MASSPGAPRAPAVQAPPPPPEARTSERGSGAGLYTLHHDGLLPPVVPAPLHQLAGPLVHHLLLPVPGPGHVLPGSLRGAHHAPDPLPEGAGLGHRVPDDHGDGGDVDGGRRPRPHRVGRPRAAQVRGRRAPRTGRRLSRRGATGAAEGPFWTLRSPSPAVTRLYSIASAVVAVTYPVCSSLLCLGVKERPGSSVPASGPGPSFLAGLVLTVRHPPYLKLVISFLFISAAIQVEQSYLVLFCTHASRLHDHVQGVVLTILVSAVLSTPLWEWVLQRFGKKTSAFGICVMVPFAILLAAVPTAPVAYVVAFVSGMSISVSLLLPWSMLPDVVDDFQLQHQHGPGLETIFYSSYVFFSKLSGAGALGISTLSLEFAGYEAGACKQVEQVVVTLKVLIGAVPTCMILTGLCILMVSPTPKVPSQNSSRRLSLQRRTSYTLA
ncbi:sphingosine-1-phosphate transporter MFSD2B isoform X5 [Prionailurus viverrinus]|uniref:sphingosine-1-phosphate transporter MFSD2B isoform X5 n=1 Tax=Prionailurus viverrinus TaxID=61388 RepID=UPI001FF3E961|nr:sphingosine-1-phosphate transporter MFSD2B isoform X5 [Prionailurus viverrinus]